MSSMPGHAQGRLGRYELLARLATGGMGEIFLARLEGAAGFEKLYVIKRVLPHLADDARFRAMLIDEARIAARMSHPNICQVYELGEDNGQLFITMEYLEGVTLLPVLRHASRAKQPLALGFVAAVLQQASDALHYAHELTERDGSGMQFVHRDVTPSNLFVTETGMIKVLDFGIAKAKDASAHTQDGQVKGKYAYMAPEQLRSEATDRRVDVFSLAIVGFEMLALRRLFQRKTDYLTFRAVMELPIPNLAEFRPDLPAGVPEVFARALQRDPALRFPTARQFGEALAAAVAGAARPWSPTEIGDFVQRTFGTELRRRGAAVGAVLRDGEARTTVPILAFDPERGGDTDDGGDDFPSIDTGEALRITTGSDPVAGPLTELAPAPAGMTANLPAPRAHLPPPSDSVVIQLPPSRRAMLWPLFAVAIVAVGAIALWLMWKQIRSQQESAGGIVIVDHGGVRAEGPGVVVLPGSSSGSAGSSSGSATPTPGSAAAPKRDKLPSTDNEIMARIKGRVADRLDAINACQREHPDGSPTKLALSVKTSGKASARVEPAAVNTSPLGACIRKVAESIDYGRLARDADLTIQLLKP